MPWAEYDRPVLHLTAHPPTLRNVSFNCSGRLRVYGNFKFAVVFIFYSPQFYKKGVLYLSQGWLMSHFGLDILFFSPLSRFPGFECYIPFLEDVYTVSMVLRAKLYNL